MILKVEGCVNAYNISSSNNEEIKQLLQQNGCKHLFGNESTLSKFSFTMIYKSPTYTIVNKIRDGVIFINKQC